LDLVCLEKIVCLSFVMLVFGEGTVELLAKPVNDIVIRQTGLSFSKMKRVEKLRELGYSGKVLTVRGEVSKSVLRDENLSEIHFLKVDVEAINSGVLKEYDLSVNRPWVIMVEQVDSFLKDQSNHQWELQVLNFDYEFIFFDGLSKCYLAIERLTLKEEFNNQIYGSGDDIVVDIMRLANLLHLSRTQKNEALKKVMVEYRREKVRLELTIQDLKLENDKIHMAAHELDNAHQQLVAITSSTIWKATYPIRYISMFLRRLKLLIKNAVNYFKVYGLRKTVSKSLAIVAGSNVIESQGERSHLTLKERKIYEVLRQGQD